MKQLLQFTTDNENTFFVEIPDESTPKESMRGMTSNENTRGVIENAVTNFEKSLKPLKEITNGIFNSLRDKDIVNPGEISVELGLKFSAKAGVIITSVDGEANLKVTLKWSKDR
jgi:hypothetical protein